MFCSRSSFFFWHAAEPNGRVTSLGKLFAFPIAAIKAEVIVTPMPGIETKRNGLAGMQRLPDSCYLAIGLSVATAASGSRIDVFNRHAFAQKLWEPTISALPMLVPSGNLSFEIGHRKDVS